MAVIERPNIITGAHARPWHNSGPPSSGTSGTLAGQIGVGDLLVDVTNGVTFQNTGSKASPYYEPVDPIGGAKLFGVDWDFRDQVGKAIADTAAEAVLAGSGLRVFGDGIAEVDSGLVAQTAGEGGILGRLTTTDEVGHMVALGLDAGVMQPDTHKLLVIDIDWTQVTDILTRALFVGFIGTAADALVEPVTVATTTATLVQDDLAGLVVDTGATDGDAWFGVHNKSDAAATQDLTADGDTGPTNLAAAATFQRMRVEIAADGDMTCFADKVQIYSQAIALDVDEECSPVAYLASNDTATRSADVRRIQMYAYRA